jgi:hypothetical protein
MEQVVSRQESVGHAAMLTTGCLLMLRSRERGRLVVQGMVANLPNRSVSQMRVVVSGAPGVVIIDSY